MNFSRRTFLGSFAAAVAAPRFLRAESAGCDWFLTTDKGILKKLRNLGQMRIANPVDFVMEDDV